MIGKPERVFPTSVASYYPTGSSKLCTNPCFSSAAELTAELFESFSRVLVNSVRLTVSTPVFEKLTLKDRRSAWSHLVTLIHISGLLVWC